MSELDPHEDDRLPRWARVTLWIGVSLLTGLACVAIIFFACIKTLGNMH